MVMSWVLIESSEGDSLIRGHCGIPFIYDMKYKALVRTRRGQCLSPHTAPLLK